MFNFLRTYVHPFIHPTGFVGKIERRAKENKKRKEKKEKYISTPCLKSLAIYELAVIIFPLIFLC